MDGIYCQRCLTMNPLGREVCARCHTRLMLVVETPTIRFENRMADAAVLPEEAALERISGVENKIGRILDQMERVLDLMFKQTNSTFENRVAFDALVSILAEANLIDVKKFIARCQEFSARAQTKESNTSERSEQQNEQKNVTAENDALRARFVEEYRGEQQRAFVRLLDEAFAAFNAGQLQRAIKKLERSAALAPDNEPLNFFLGAYFFQERKMTLARSYLERALRGRDANEQSRAARWRVEVLLGIACGDEGVTDEAKKILRASLKGASTFAAHFALGRLAALAGDWKAAYNAFRLAQEECGCAEIDYAVGLAALHLKHPRIALRHLQNAAVADERFARAHHLLGFAHLHLKQRAHAVSVWRKAVETAANETEKSQFQKTLGAAVKSNRALKLPSARAAFGMTKEAASRKRRTVSAHLLTSGDERFARILIDGALDAAAADWARLLPADHQNLRISRK
jgi:tetratricopeptide (TPR) repeat protein